MKDLSANVAANKLVVEEAQQQLRAKVIADFKEQKAHLFYFLAQVLNGETETGYVVVLSELLPLRFNVEGEQLPRISTYRMATLFSEDEAKRLAAITKNGAGKAAEAMTLDALLIRQIKNIVKCLNDLESL